MYRPRRDDLLAAARSNQHTRAVKSHPPESNRRPTDYESVALPTELGWPGGGRLLTGPVRAGQARWQLAARHLARSCGGRATLARIFTVVGGARDGYLAELGAERHASAR